MDSRIYPISQSYLWFPVKKDREEKKICLYVEGQQIEEIDIRLGDGSLDFYAAADLGDYRGKSLEIRGDITAGEESGFVWSDEQPEHAYPYRPKIHFAPKVGWHNDPNGMLYHDGWYHLYYQWNPYGVLWGNLFWGHAKSRDLLHWEHEPAALRPDETGLKYSGCGFVDRDNVAGFGPDAFLFYYTAAGGRNEWSRHLGNDFKQLLAVSTDGGRTLVPTDRFQISHVVNENRDPKVFYHAESGAYIMVLYLDGHEFAIYRSSDLLHWEETGRISERGMWECPDLFELPVEGADRKKWVFWSADGYYVVGNFDGHTFEPQTSPQLFYGSKVPYAAQTFANTGDRVIGMAWMRLHNDRGNYRGLMSLPYELSLVLKGGEYRMKFSLPEEYESRKGEWSEVPADRPVIRLEGKPTELFLRWKIRESGKSRLQIGNILITADFYDCFISFMDTGSHRIVMSLPFDVRDGYEMRLVIDQEVIECLAQDGTIYGAIETAENILGQKIVFDSLEAFESAKYCAVGE